MKNRVIEEVLQEIRSEKNYLLNISEENLKRVNESRGTETKGTRKKLEVRMYRNYLGLGYEVGYKFPPSVNREKRLLNSSQTDLEIWKKAWR